MKSARDYITNGGMNFFKRTGDIWVKWGQAIRTVEEREHQIENNHRGINDRIKKNDYQ